MFFGFVFLSGHAVRSLVCLWLEHHPVDGKICVKEITFYDKNMRATYGQLTCW